MTLILGRFQPLHNGHLKVIKDAFAEDKDIIIAVGSSQKKDEKSNPFSGEERKMMIKTVLDANEINTDVYLVPDIDSDEEYVKHVEKIVCRRFKKVITENNHTVELFRKAGYDVKVTPRYFGISATGVRQKIAEDGNWDKDVPSDVVRLIKKFGGVEKIKRLSKE